MSQRRGGKLRFAVGGGKLDYACRRTIACNRWTYEGLNAVSETGTKHWPASDEAVSSKVTCPRGRWRRSINGCVALYWIAMFVGTHMPNPEAIVGTEVSDKLLHFSAYFVLMALLLGRDRLLAGHWPTASRIFRGMVLVTAYAAADELLQAVPGINRHADFQDALADVAGAFGAAAVCFLWARYGDSVSRNA